MLDWLVVIEMNGVRKTRAEYYDGKISKFAKNLRIQGEAGVLETRTVKTSKLQDRGVTTMFVGYNLNMGSDVYRMWNEEIKRIHNTKDITWLNVYNNNRNCKTNVLHPTPSAWENKSKVTDEDGSCLEIIDNRMRVDASDSNDDGDGDGGDDYDNNYDCDGDGVGGDDYDDDNESADDNTITDDRSIRRGTKTRSGRVTVK